MGGEGNQDDGALVFVYNAESGLFNAVGDMSRKILSPETYQCNLCALTYSTFRMRKSWKQFIETLGRPSEFLHADELSERHGVSGVPLPAVFTKEGGSLKLHIEASEIQQCRTLDDLMGLVRKRVL
ncbi:MAG TPA: hypothetical protein VN256_05800 [Pyrinomonadaceae bacterium]|nr:hypothetical protein [Pyrinomonadaceae bacterium]